MVLLAQNILTYIEYIADLSLDEINKERSELLYRQVS